MTVAVVNAVCRAGRDSGSPRTSPLAPRDAPVSLWWDAPPMTYAAQEGAEPESEGTKDVPLHRLQQSAKSLQQQGTAGHAAG